MIIAILPCFRANAAWILTNSSSVVRATMPPGVTQFILSWKRCLGDG